LTRVVGGTQVIREDTKRHRCGRCRAGWTRSAVQTSLAPNSWPSWSRSCSPSHSRSRPYPPVALRVPVMIAPVPPVPLMVPVLLPSPAALTVPVMIAPLAAGRTHRPGPAPAHTPGRTHSPSPAPATARPPAALASQSPHLCRPSHSQPHRPPVVGEGVYAARAVGFACRAARSGSSCHLSPWVHTPPFGVLTCGNPELSDLGHNLFLCLSRQGGSGG
jgi:hypothetical protein